MESISKIIDAISAEGEAAAEKILESSRKSAEETIKLYKKEARIDEEEIIKRTERQTEEIRQRSISQAGIESRNIRLSAKRKALEKTFKLAEEKLNEFSPEKKKALYEKLIERFAEGKDVVVQLNEKDMKELGGKLEVKNISVSLDKEAGAFNGGLIIKEGAMETNCTFEVIIEDSKKAMESKIAAMLFS